MSNLLLAFLIQSVLVTAITLIAVRLIPSRLPAIRVVILRAGLASVLALAVAGPFVQGIVRPWWSLTPAPHHTTPRFSLPEHNWDAHATVGSTFTLEPTPKIAPVTKLTPVAAPAFEATPPRYEHIFLAVWLLGAAGLLVRLGLGLSWLMRLHRRSVSLEFSPIGQRFNLLREAAGVRTTHLALSREVKSPFVAGVLRPSVFLPENLESEFDTHHVDAVLLHELAHVQQADCAWALVGKIACALAWPNLLLWLLVRRLATASEELCDQVVILQGIHAQAYADCLLLIAERIVSAPAERYVGSGVFPSPSHLSRRISLVLHSSKNPVVKLSRRIRFASSASAITVGLASCLLVSASTPKVPAAIPVQHGVAEKPVRTFEPSQAELSAVKASGLPYIPGDFTLTYDVVSRDITPRDAREKQTRDIIAWRVQTKQLTQAEADQKLKEELAAKGGGSTNYVVTVSCRNGRLLYREQQADGSGHTTMVDGAHVYWLSTNTDQAEVGNIFSPGLMIFLPLPAAGYAHLPLSLIGTPTPEGRSSVRDLPVLEAVGRRYPMENGLEGELHRAAGSVEIAKSPSGPRLVHLTMGGGTEYSFESFAKLKGVQIASNYTALREERSLEEFSLISASDKALPEAEFDPSAFLDGREVMTDHVRFKFEAKLGSLEAQAQVEAAREKQSEDKEAAYEAAPVGGPDVMPLYEAAKSQAQEDGKLVFAMSTSSICPPAHWLYKLLTAPEIAPIVEPRFVILRVGMGERDRSIEPKNGIRLCKQLDLWNTGCPSFSVLTPDGKIVDKSGPIGYPQQPKEIDSFVRVLNASPNKLSQEEEATVRGYLAAHPNG